MLTSGSTKLLTNDTDPEGSPVAVSSFGPPAYGTLTVNADGTFRHTHDGPETTTDSFIYPPMTGS